MNAALPPIKAHSSGITSSRLGIGPRAASNTPKVNSVTGHGVMPNIGIVG